MGRTYKFCNGCERRIDEILFEDGRCRGCRETAELKLTVAKGEYFTEEEYAEMDAMIPGREEY